MCSKKHISGPSIVELQFLAGESSSQLPEILLNRQKKNYLKSLSVLQEFLGLLSYACHVVMKT